jgi:predicted ChrR family anti-sigma factor
MSSSHVTELLPEYALGSLEASDGTAVTVHLDACGDCTAELAELEDALASVALSLDPVAPSADLRDRLLQAANEGRFAGFAERFSAIFDVAVDRAKELLTWIDDPARWEPGPAAKTGLIHFPAGAACAGADTGFVRVEPGVLFPWHLHNGEELNVVLQGACVDSNGTTYRSGDEFVNAGDTEHDFRAIGDVDYIFMVRVRNGVDFDRSKPSNE